MSPILSRIYGADGGPETLDVLMKYLYEYPLMANLPPLESANPLTATKAWPNHRQEAGVQIKP